MANQLNHATSVGDLCVCGCRDKQAELEIIQDKLATQMRQKVSGEDARIQTAIAEREAQKAADEAEKEQKRATMLQSIKEHRIEQVEFQRDFY